MPFLATVPFGCSGDCVCVTLGPCTVEASTFYVTVSWVWRDVGKMGVDHRGKHTTSAWYVECQHGFLVLGGNGVALAAGRFVIVVYVVKIGERYRLRVEDWGLLGFVCDLGRAGVSLGVGGVSIVDRVGRCLLYTSPSPRDS